MNRFSDKVALWIVLSLASHSEKKTIETKLIRVSKPVWRGGCWAVVWRWCWQSVSEVFSGRGLQRWGAEWMQAVDPTVVKWVGGWKKSTGGRKGKGVLHGLTCFPTLHGHFHRQKSHPPINIHVTPNCLNHCTRWWHSMCHMYTVVEWDSTTSCPSKRWRGGFWTITWMTQGNLNTLWEIVPEAEARVAEGSNPQWWRKESVDGLESEEQDLVDNVVFDRGTSQVALGQVTNGGGGRKTTLTIHPLSYAMMSLLPISSSQRAKAGKTPWTPGHCRTHSLSPTSNLEHTMSV